MIDRVSYRLHFPRDLTPEQVLGVLLAINGASTVQASSLRFSLRSAAGQLEHRLELPRTGSGLPVQLPRLLPGLRLDEEEGAGPTAPSHAWRLWQSSSRRPLRVDHPELTTPAILTALQAARGPEWLELHWVLGPVRRPLSVGSKHAGMLSESWPLALATAAVRPPGDLGADARHAPSGSSAASQPGGSWGNLPPTPPTAVGRAASQLAFWRRSAPAKVPASALVSAAPVRGASSKRHCAGRSRSTPRSSSGCWRGRWPVLKVCPLTSSAPAV